MTVPTKPDPQLPVEAIWGQILHDTAVGMDIQAGIATPVASSGEVTNVLNVVFPRPFAAPPHVVMSCNNFNYWPGFSGTNPTETGFSMAVRRYLSNGGTAGVHWIAYGPRK